jgi:outer membrane lipopolysaccharide assembly protein LptE/RlpB
MKLPEMKTENMQTAILIILGMLLIAGCGYRLEGGGYVHRNVARVGVEVFENNSAQTRAGIAFTNELIREIQEETDTKVMDPADAPRRIKGRVKAITFSTLSRSSTETVTERRITAVVDVQLLDADGDVLWSANNFSSFDSYLVDSDKINDEASINDAIGIIAQRIAERLVSQMMANF